MMRSIVTAGLAPVASQNVAVAHLAVALAEPPAIVPTPADLPRARFVNPIHEGADPWVVREGRSYYFCQSEGNARISVACSSRLTDRGARSVVWKPRRGSWNSREIWAPELHRIHSRWYIYYCGSDGRNENHRGGVLRARTEDPLGPYEEMGTLYTGDHIETSSNNRWCIDPTPLQIGEKLYCLWSGWPESRDHQFLYIAPMSNPWTISGNRVRLCANDCHVWERVSERADQRGLNEGPQVLKRHGRTFIVYSCSNAWEHTYKLNMLWMNDGADPLDPASWTKSAKPVFHGKDGVCGVGHASFTTSPDGTEDWIVYHAKRFRRAGWKRDVFAQRFTWTADGFPDFGSPCVPQNAIDAPSGEGDQTPVPFESPVTAPAAPAASAA